MSVEDQDAAVDALLRETLAADLPPSDFADRVVEARVEQPRSGSSRRQWGFAIAAAVALGVGGALLFAPTTPADRAAPPAPMPAGVATSIAQPTSAAWTVPVLAPPSAAPATEVVPLPPSAAPATLFEGTTREAMDGIRDALSEHDIAGAQAIYDAAIKQAPTDLKLQALGCKILKVSGAPSETVVRCAQSMTGPMPAGDAEARSKARYATQLARARRLMVQGNRREAIEILDVMRATWPKAKTPMQMLCALLPRTGRTRDALRSCQAWAEHETNPVYRAQARSRASRLKALLEDEPPR